MCCDIAFEVQTTLFDILFEGQMQKNSMKGQSKSWLLYMRVFPYSNLELAWGKGQMQSPNGALAKP